MLGSRTPCRIPSAGLGGYLPPCPQACALMLLSCIVVFFPHLYVVDVSSSSSSSYLLVSSRPISPHLVSLISFSCFPQSLKSRASLHVPSVFPPTLHLVYTLASASVSAYTMIFMIHICLFKIVRLSLKWKQRKLKICNVSFNVRKFILLVNKRLIFLIFPCSNNYCYQILFSFPY